jgi:hypothetical protein
MWNVLWVQLGQSFSAIDLPKSARSNVQSALESEVGNLLGGGRGRTLPQAIEKQLGELVTANNKPREKYKKVIEQIQLLQDVLQSLHARREGLSEAFVELEAAQEKLARLSTAIGTKTAKTSSGKRVSAIPNLSSSEPGYKRRTVISSWRNWILNRPSRRKRTVSA